MMKRARTCGKAPSRHKETRWKDEVAEAVKVKKAETGGKKGQKTHGRSIRSVENVQRKLYR